MSQCKLRIWLNSRWLILKCLKETRKLRQLSAWPKPIWCRRDRLTHRGHLGDICQWGGLWLVQENGCLFSNANTSPGNIVTCTIRSSLHCNLNKKFLQGNPFKDVDWKKLVILFRPEWVYLFWPSAGILNLGQHWLGYWLSVWQH